MIPSDTDEMTNRLTLFANSGAGSVQSQQLREIWYECVPDHCRGGAYFLQSTDTFESTLASALADCQRRDSALIVAGGDGTLSSVINTVAGSDQRIAFLPQGTFNFFARSRGVPLDPKLALEFALNAKTVALSLAYLNDHAFIVNVGLGLYPKIIAARESHQQVTGRSSVSAIASGIWTLLRERHLSRAKLHYDGGTHRLITPLLVIGHNRSQLEQLDPRFVVAAKKLTVLRMHPVHKFKLLKILANGLIGRLLDEENMDCFGVDELTVQMPGKSVRVALDGELIKMPLPLQFTVRPNAIQCLLQEGEA